MSQRYVLVNQDGHYFAKKKHWTDGRDASRVFMAKHHDEALNTLLEINAKDISLRLQVLVVELDERDLPILDISDIPCPEPEPDPVVLDEAEQGEDANGKSAEGTGTADEAPDGIHSPESDGNAESSNEVKTSEGG